MLGKWCNGEDQHPIESVAADLFAISRRLCQCVRSRRNAIHQTMQRGQTGQGIVTIAKLRDHNGNKKC